MAKKINKKVLIHSIVFSPDSVSTAYLYNDIALELKNNNYDVEVLTTTPHYNIIESKNTNQKIEKVLFGLYYKSFFNGIKVYHVPLKKYKNTFLRLLSFIYWHFFTIIISFKIKKIDYVIAPSPPLTIGLVALIISFFKSSKCIYNVQEIYPDLLIKQGSLKNKLLIKFFKQVEKVIYNFSDAVVTIDPIFFSIIEKRIKNKSKLHLIENFVDTSIYNPTNNKKMPKSFNKNDNQIIFTYAGNIGVYQDWDPIIYAAKKLKNLNIVFWIIGEGSKKMDLVKKINKNKLNNIKIYPYQDRDLIPSIINNSDCHFISANEKMDSFGFPSKVYTIMACKKPLIIISGIKSPLHNFLKNKESSILIDFKNKNEKFTKAILKIYQDKDLRFDLGEKAYNYLINNFTKEIIVKKYTNLLDTFNNN